MTRKMTRTKMVRGFRDIKTREDIKILKGIKCPACNGTGIVAKTRLSCGVCGGGGFVKDI
ncbi:MAG: hypothetical protein IBX41_04180 [Methanophagales archaeon]|nr:hypothetical protein [Methanophagales archaeon]